ncbi:hypothetical protein GGF41_001122 [Coemansia sp. RSA 2531]|nr:hypothetical protein GGF41_001122 [Coemansia sp. RSA 2531]
MEALKVMLVGRYPGCKAEIESGNFWSDENARIQDGDKDVMFSVMHKFKPSKNPDEKPHEDTNTWMCSIITVPRST